DPALALCGGDGAYRFSAATGARQEAELFPALLDLRQRLLELCSGARELFDDLPERAEDDAATWEARAIIRRFETVAGICQAFTEHRQRQSEVMWIERRRSGGGDDGAAFTQSPVDLAGSLRESLFRPHKTVVCVSATLAVNGGFDYWAARSGASLVELADDGASSKKKKAPPAPRAFYTGNFPSPFPYSSAVLLAVPSDAPLPEEPSYQGFVNKAVGKLAAISGGSALALFTSYQSLNGAWNACASELQALGIRCLKQGDDDRTRLLQTFLSDTSSVLFATSSFWEGVDAPGDTLRLVILCRLPFRAPNDPVFEARREALQKAGGNPFMDLSLPEAVTKFKQGFGRLMRRSADRGVVAVLDGRLIKKRYGEIFLRSLPKTGTSFSGFDGVLRDMESFLF
ncbi:MAG: ATP-dependent DNA helicase DinG, partial [Treponema sp.]|nr:ATP-dependent DNA helicase DinG [Treponema sp.]